MSTSGVLRQRPRLGLVECFVDSVSERHRVAHDLRILSPVVSFRGVAETRPEPLVQKVDVGARHRSVTVEVFGYELCRAAGDIDVLPNQIAVDSSDEIIRIEIDVLDLVVEFGGDVVAQPFRVQAEVEIVVGADTRAARFGHLLAERGQEAVYVDVIRHLVRCARELEHRRPEERVEVDDVLADKMNLPRFGIGQNLLEASRLAGAERRAGRDILLQASQIADGRVEPDVKILARRIGNRNAEVRRIT